MRQVICFVCEYKFSETLPSSVVVQPLSIFNATKIVLHEVLSSTAYFFEERAWDELEQRHS